MKTDQKNNDDEEESKNKYFLQLIDDQDKDLLDRMKAQSDLHIEHLVHRKLGDEKDAAGIVRKDVYENTCCRKANRYLCCIYSDPFNIYKEGLPCTRKHLTDDEL